MENILAKNFRLGLILTAVREVVTRKRISRIPEPDLVMDDPEKVEAYTNAGKENGVMGGVYLFHCAQICEVIKPGDKVVDLGCGPGTQLAMVARLNPEIQFIGVDLSEEMLDKARLLIKEKGLDNVQFIKGDITNLSFFKDNSIDAVFSTVAAHQLPDIFHFNQMIAEVGRIVKPNGGIYIVDFTRLKSEKSIQFFSHRASDLQPELFTIDYLNSLRAAFTLKDFQHAIDTYLKGRAKLSSTFILPFMAVIKTSRRNTGSSELRNALKKLYKNLPQHQIQDLKDLSLFFRLGGLRSKIL